MLARSSVEFASVGLSFHPLLFDAMLRGRFAFDFIEAPLGLYVDTARAALLDPGQLRLRQMAERWPIVWRGSAFSLGSVEDCSNPAPDAAALERFVKLRDLTRPVALIETLGFRSLGARDLGHSLRLPLSPFAADWIAARIRALRDAIGLPVWLQLATAGFDASSNALCEFEFLERIAEQTDCEFILDVSDITRLTQQSGLDERAAMQQLARLPIVSLTLSGELESAWPTLAMALEAMTPRMIVVRRTETLFPLDAIGETLRRAKSMLKDRPEPAVATTRSGVAPALLDHDAAAALRLWQSSVIDELASGTADRRPGGVSGWDNWRLRIAEIHKGHEIKKFLSST